MSNVFRGIKQRRLKFNEKFLQNAYILAKFFSILYNNDMEKFCVAVSSSADLYTDERLNNSIFTIPVKYLDGKVFKADNTDNPPVYRRFYDKLRNGRTFKLRFPQKQDFGEFFDELIEQGHSSIIYVATSSVLSSDYDNAKKAAMESMIKYRKSEIYVLDSLCVGPQKGVVALRAASYRTTMNAAEAFITLKEEVSRLCTFAVIYDYSFIARSGLVSENALKGGEQLGIKPVLTVTSTGELTVYKKAKSEKNAIMSVIKYAEEHATDKTTFFVYTADNTRNELFAIRMLQEKFPGCSIKTGCAGMTNGILFAPNAIFISFYAPRIRPETTKKPLKIYADIDKIDGTK